ncbi:Acyltransferase 3 [Mycena indigotica]|uniref:Acyltransferase 3 n=1 Tax=Mycena indigotica TaxID=2126181 RepID=A0A8H6WHE8_9AGAR|nr:Acyltransferase 3 [Mycena indigotica]KAF7312399.1 Acyltransferase 3 [Mycena indigotica]
MHSNHGTEFTPLLSPPIKQRIHFIDNLRSFIIGLVIVEHALAPFGGENFCRFVSQYPTEPVSHATMLLYGIIHQSFFMGLLFFLAGHFSAVAAENKSPWVFSVDKLKRLGLPLACIELVGEPLAIALVQMDKGDSALPRVKMYFNTWQGVRGPAWFIATLLAFDLIYIVLKVALSSIPIRIEYTPTSASRHRVAASIGITAVIFCSFLVRLYFPVGHMIPVLGLQPGYAPQYIFAFVAGTSLSQIQPYLLMKNPAPILLFTYLVAGLTIALIFSLHNDIADYLGGWNRYAVFYATWNEVCFYFLGAAWFSLFHQNELTKKQWAKTARYSYGVYLVHPLVVLALQMSVDRLVGELNGIVKTMLVVLLGIPLSWATSRVLTQIPPVGRII